MASIEPPRIRKDGTVTYRVRWRKGGTRDGKREGEPFDDLAAAEDFCAAVKRAGEEWPWGYVPGIGWDAQAYAELTAGTHGGGESAPARPATTFEEFALKYADHRTGVQPQTRKKLRADITNYMIPTFGPLAIDDDDAIDEFTVAAWVLGLQERITRLGTPMAPGTIGVLHSALYSIMKAAVRARLRTTNPCEETELLTADDLPDDEMVFLTREEFHILLAAANADVRDLMTVLVNTGLRWSEITALQVRDVVDLLGPKPYLRIQRAWKLQPDSTFKLGPPKSKRSRRNVSVNRVVVEILIGLIAGNGQKDFLFVTATQGHAWRHSQFHGTRWLPAVYRAIRCEGHRAEDGLKGINNRGLRKKDLVPCGCPGTLEKVPRVHDMRHSQAAWLIADGAPLTAIQRRLGHQSIKTTSDQYGHLMPEVDDAIIAALDAKWEASLPGADVRPASVRGRQADIPGDLVRLCRLYDDAVIDHGCGHPDAKAEMRRLTAAIDAHPWWGFVDSRFAAAEALRTAVANAG